MEEPWQGNKRDIRLGFWEKGWGVLDRAVDRRKQISGDLYNGNKKWHARIRGVSDK